MYIVILRPDWTVNDLNQPSVVYCFDNIQPSCRDSYNKLSGIFQVNKACRFIGIKCSK